LHLHACTYKLFGTPKRAPTVGFSASVLRVAVIVGVTIGGSGLKIRDKISSASRLFQCQ